MMKKKRLLSVLLKMWKSKHKEMIKIPLLLNSHTTMHGNVSNRVKQIVFNLFQQDWEPIPVIRLIVKLA